MNKKKRLFIFSGATGALLSTTLLLGNQIKDHNYTVQSFMGVGINFAKIILLTIPFVFYANFSRLLSRNL